MNKFISFLGELVSIITVVVLVNVGDIDVNWLVPILEFVYSLSLLGHSLGVSLHIPTIVESSHQVKANNLNYQECKAAQRSHCGL